MNDLKLSHQILLHYLLRKHKTNIKQATQEAIEAYGLNKIVLATPTDHHIQLETEGYIARASKYGRVTELKRKPGAKRPARPAKTSKSRKPKSISKEARIQAAYDQRLEHERRQEQRTITVTYKRPKPQRQT